MLSVLLESKASLPQWHLPTALIFQQRPRGVKLLGQGDGGFRLHGEKLRQVVYLFVAAGKLFPKVLDFRIGALKLRFEGHYIVRPIWGLMRDI